jgi:hypothetical protein
MSARAVKCRFLGVSDGTKGYGLWDMYNDRHFVSRDVMFDSEFAGIVRRAFLITISYSHKP